jgi:hypothetical protein
MWSSDLSVICLLIRQYLTEAYLGGGGLVCMLLISVLSTSSLLDRLESSKGLFNSSVD